MGSDVPALTDHQFTAPGLPGLAEPVPYREYLKHIWNNPGHKDGSKTPLKHGSVPYGEHMKHPWSTHAWSMEHMEHMEYRWSSSGPGSGPRAYDSKRSSPGPSRPAPSQAGHWPRGEVRGRICP